MRLPTLALVLCLSAAAPAFASEIYQWKDANGVTHYSETPPPSGTAFQQRRITASGASSQAATTPASTAPAAAAGPESAHCTAARENIQALQGDAPVQQDDGDGNVVELDAQGRANQLELARAAERAYCR